MGFTSIEGKNTLDITQLLTISIRKIQPCSPCTVADGLSNPCGFGVLHVIAKRVDYRASIRSMIDIGCSINADASRQIRAGLFQARILPQLEQWVLVSAVGIERIPSDRF